jgi:hypothetical protein
MASQIRAIPPAPPKSPKTPTRAQVLELGRGSRFPCRRRGLRGQLQRSVWAILHLQHVAWRIALPLTVDGTAGQKLLENWPQRSSCRDEVR